MKNKGSFLRTVIIVVVLIAVFITFALMLSKAKKPAEIALMGEVENPVSVQYLIKNNKVAELFVSGDVVYVRLVDSQAGITHEKLLKGHADYMAKCTSTTNFSTLLNVIKSESGVNLPTITYDNPANRQQWTSLIFPAVGLLALILFMFFIYKQNAGSNSKVMNFGKSKARLSTNVKVRFSDVAGAEEEKEELQEIVEFLKSPKKFSAVGARVPKGVLLVGPPGTGKTLFAKAVAGEANVPFFFISGSDFVEMFVGTGASRVRDLFNQAKRNMPCIVFIDEIDAVGRQRGAGLGGGNDEKEQTLNQLLVEMDGFEKEDQIIVLAATNRADVLDPALIRPGRFDRQIYVHIPDVKGREEILKVHARNKPISSSVSFKTIARMTVGFTGADIENLLNEAAILAARANRSQIEVIDLLEAINKVIAGPKKKSRVVTTADKRITAYHESGHAIIAKLLPLCDEVQEVSIIPRGMAAGYTLTRPESDDSHVTKNKLNDNIAMLLGGRAAEEVFIQDISTGASNDIERATAIAKKMVTEWGMSETFGNMCLNGGQEVFLGRDYAMHSTISDQTAHLIDKEVQDIVETNYKRTLSLIKEHKDVLENMVKVLFARDTIYTNEVDMLFAGKSAEEVISYIDEKVSLLGSEPIVRSTLFESFEEKDNSTTEEEPSIKSSPLSIEKDDE